MLGQQYDLQTSPAGQGTAEWAGQFFFSLEDSILGLFCTGP